MPSPTFAFGLADYRSFGEQGFLLTDHKRVNVFIGKNNSGKSNILRGIHALAQFQSPTHGASLFKPLHDGHRPSNPTTKGLVSFTASEVFPLTGGVDWQLQHVVRSIKSPIALRWDTHTGKPEGIQGLDGLRPTELHGLMGLMTGRHFQHLQSSVEPYLQHISQGLLELSIKRIREAFAGFLSIPVFREIRHGGDNPESAWVFNGVNIIDSLREMKSPNVGDEKKEATFETIQQFARELVGVPDLILEVPAKEDRVVLRMHQKRLPLENYGTGIHHLVILCTALAMHKDKVVTIEEPEIHLHPELQRKFLTFLVEKTTNAYFITTHSNVFLDAHPEVKVYHVRYDGSASTCEHVETTARARDILTDMGYKASDLLQSNGVVWVEGPSDRVYLKRWLSLIAPNLVEGLHYAVAFYGGKVLAHFSMTDDPVDDLVEVLRINRNSVVMMDRDGDDETAKLTKSKDRIIRELSGGFCWVTAGREVENYLPARLVDQFLTTAYPGALPFPWRKNARFGAALTKHVKPLGKGIPSYDKNKVKYAREFASRMGDADLDTLDLRDRLTELVSQIHRWNHSDVPSPSA